MQKKQINNLLVAFHLEDVKDKRMGSCSGGMKQRVGIICALLDDPQRPGRLSGLQFFL